MEAHAALDGKATHSVSRRAPLAFTLYTTVPLMASRGEQVVFLD